MPITPLSTRLSTKGQLVLPQEVRERHGWAPGTVFEIEERRDGVLLRVAGAGAETTLDELIGCTGYRGPRRSLEEMEEAIARQAARTAEPGR
jgi:AbrB family looped-hinge helix DNA binding protein